MRSRRVSLESSQLMRKFCASLNLRMTARAVTRIYDRALRPLGVTSTQLPLLAAINAGVNASINCLAQDLDLERSTVSRELDVLKRRGLVVAEAALDRRATKLTLTPLGNKTLAAGFRGWQRAHESITREYGEEDFEQLLHHARRLRQHASEIGKRRGK